MQREADELIDLPLRQDTVGAWQVVRVAGALLDHGGPFGRHVARVGRGALLGERRAPLVGKRSLAAVPGRRRGLNRARALLGERCRPIAVEGLVFR